MLTPAEDVEFVLPSSSFSTVSCVALVPIKLIFISLSKAVLSSFFFISLPLNLIESSPKSLSVFFVLISASPAFTLTVFAVIILSFSINAFVLPSIF